MYLCIYSLHHKKKKLCIMKLLGSGMLGLNTHVHSHTHKKKNLTTNNYPRSTNNVQSWHNDVGLQM